MKKRLKISMSALLFAGLFTFSFSNVNSQQLSLDVGKCSCDASSAAKCVAKSGDCKVRGTGAAEVETDFF